MQKLECNKANIESVILITEEFCKIGYIIRGHFFGPHQSIKVERR